MNDEQQSLVEQADKIWADVASGDVLPADGVRKLLALFDGGITEEAAIDMVVSDIAPSRWREKLPEGMAAGTTFSLAEMIRQALAAGSIRESLAAAGFPYEYKLIYAENHWATAAARPDTEEAFAEFRQQAIAMGWAFDSNHDGVDLDRAAAAYLAETVPVQPTLPQPEPRMQRYRKTKPPTDIEWAWPRIGFRPMLVENQTEVRPLSPELKARMEEMLARWRNT